MASKVEARKKGRPEESALSSNSVSMGCSARLTATAPGVSSGAEGGMSALGIPQAEARHGVGSVLDLVAGTGSKSGRGSTL